MSLHHRTLHLDGGRHSSGLRPRGRSYITASSSHLLYKNSGREAFQCSSPSSEHEEHVFLDYEWMERALALVRVLFPIVLTSTFRLRLTRVSADVFATENDIVCLSLLCGNSDRRQKSWKPRVIHSADGDKQRRDGRACYWKSK